MKNQWFPGRYLMVRLITGMAGVFAALVTLPVMAAGAGMSERHPGLGTGLLLAGLALIVIEALTPTIGIIGTLGLVAFVAGAILLYDAGWLPGGDSLWGLALLLLAALIMASFLCWVVLRAIRLRRQQPRGGQEAVLHAHAEALTRFEADGHTGYRGHVRLHGERWQARSASPISEGDVVRVTALEGLTVTVVPLESGEVADS